MLQPAQALLQRAADGRGDAGAVPVEAQHAAEGLEPERVGQAAEHLARAVLLAMARVISRASSRMRVNSQAGALPPCRGRVAVPVLMK